MGFFQRIAALFNGFISLFIRSAEDANPELLLENETNKANQAIADANVNLGKAAGNVKRLDMQIASDTKERDLAASRAKSLAASGQPALIAQAGPLAVKAKQLTEAIATNTAAREVADKLYKDLTRQRDVYLTQARARLTSVKGKINQAKLAESMASLATTASTHSFDLSGGGLAQLEDRLDQRVADASGRIRVAQEGLATSSFNVTEEEQKAQEALALQELLGLPMSATLVQPTALPAPAVQDAVIEDDIAALKVGVAAN